MSGSIIIPGKSCGAVGLGQSREHIRATLKCDVDEFRDENGRVADHFVDVGVQTYFTADETCERVVAYVEASPILNGKKIVGLKKAEFLAALLEIGAHPRDIADFVFDPEAGVGATFMGGRAWSIEVFSHGYHDELVLLSQAAG